MDDLDVPMSLSTGPTLISTWEEADRSWGWTPAFSRRALPFKGFEECSRGQANTAAVDAAKMVSGLASRFGTLLERICPRERDGAIGPRNGATTLCRRQQTAVVVGMATWI